MQGHSAGKLTSQVKENPDGIVPKSFPESDAQPVVSVSSVCPLPTSVRSPEILWFVVTEGLDCIPSVLKAASQFFTEVQVHRPEDIVEDFFFEKVLAAIPVCTHCLFIAPRSTFTHKVRGTTAPDICGKTELSSEVKSRVRSQTLAAFRCADLAARLQGHGTRWIIVCPASEEPSVYDLPEVRRLLSHPGVTATRGPTSRSLVAPSTKASVS